MSDGPAPPIRPRGLEASAQPPRDPGSESGSAAAEPLLEETSLRLPSFSAAPGFPATPSRYGHQPSQAWLITFTDLVALMLTFMVLLFAMSKVEQRKWQNLVDALTQGLNAVREVPAAVPSEPLGVEAVETLPGFDLDYLAALLKQNLAGDALLAEAVLIRLDGRLVIALPSSLLFEAGSVQPAPRAAEVVAALAAHLRHVGNKIEVAGHADPRPPARGIASNWELSLARARNVAFLLNASGHRGLIVARGYGYSRFDGLSPWLEGAQRLAIGRRVEVVIHDYREDLP